MLWQKNLTVAGASGLPSRNRYVIDPSVQSNRQNQYDTNPLAQPLLTQPTPYNANAIPGMIPGVTSYAPTYPSSTTAPMTSFSGHNPSVFNHGPAPGSFLNPTAQSNWGYHGENNSNDVSKPQEIGTPALNFGLRNSAAGWNDPPVFSKSTRPQVSVMGYSCVSQVYLERAYTYLFSNFKCILLVWRKIHNVWGTFRFEIVETSPVRGQAPHEQKRLFAYTFIFVNKPILNNNFI